jgi:hypothetical protein
VHTRVLPTCTLTFLALYMMRSQTAHCPVQPRGRSTCTICTLNPQLGLNERKIAPSVIACWTAGLIKAPYRDAASAVQVQDAAQNAWPSSAWHTCATARPSTLCLSHAVFSDSVVVCIALHGCTDHLAPGDAPCNHQLTLVSHIHMWAPSSQQLVPMMRQSMRASSLHCPTLRM